MDRKLHLKSSVLTPLNRSLASQLESQQHLLAHYKRVGETKARVDTKAPRSLLHSIAWKDQQQNRGGLSNQRSQSSTPTTTFSLTQKHATYQRNHSSTLKKSTLPRHALDKGGFSVAHKITWYLEAVQNHNLCAAHGAPQNNTEKKVSRRPCPIQTKAPATRKPGKNEPNVRQKQKASFKKQISHDLRKTATRTFNVPCNEILEVPHYRTWLREQAVRAKIRKETSFSQGTNSGSDSGRETDRSSPAAINLKQHTDSYRLTFLNEVTEDILNMGLFSNRAIKKAIEFHVEQYRAACIIEEAELDDLSKCLMESLNVTTADEKYSNADYNSYFSYGR